MQIILVRHAKVSIDSSIKLKASQMRGWVERYDSSPIETSPPAPEVIAKINNADLVLSSSLTRTKDSLAAIGVFPKEANSLFDEAEIPRATGSLFRFRPKTWLVILRLMMLAGIGKKSQSLKASKGRAKEAAKYLVALSKKYDSIALMGHGGMNWLIGRELQKLGWKLEEQYGGNSNWSYRVYIIESKAE